MNVAGMPTYGVLEAGAVFPCFYRFGASLCRGDTHPDSLWSVTTNAARVLLSLLEREEDDHGITCATLCSVGGIFTGVVVVLQRLLGWSRPARPSVSWGTSQPPRPWITSSRLNSSRPLTGMPPKPWSWKKQIIFLAGRYRAACIVDIARHGRYHGDSSSDGPHE